MHVEVYSNIYMILLNRLYRTVYHPNLCIAKHKMVNNLGRCHMKAKYEEANYCLKENCRKMTWYMIE